MSTSTITIRPGQLARVSPDFHITRGLAETHTLTLLNSSGTAYDVYYLLDRTPEQLGETTDSYVEAVYQTLVAGIGDPGNAGKLIKRYCTQLPKSSIPRPERFAKLQMLNDIYTGKLIEDKAAWGDVIAQIRTVMELYK